MYKELNMTEHRPFPLPSSPWVMTQSWDELLFMHWEIEAQQLRPHIPAQLEIDTYGGKAYLAVVPFAMNGIQFRGLPKIPMAHSFLELNVRTYVKYEGVPGVYFFSLDANHAPAVWAARTFFSLPYLNARMNIHQQGKVISYESRRTDKNSPRSLFKVDYEPTSPTFFSEKGSLEQWLTERYVLWSVKGRNVYRGDIHHKPWELQQAKVNIDENEMTPFLEGNPFKGTPHLLYSKSIRAFIYPLQKMQKR